MSPISALNNLSSLSLPGLNTDIGLSTDTSMPAMDFTGDNIEQVLAKLNAFNMANTLPSTNLPFEGLTDLSSIYAMVANPALTQPAATEQNPQQTQNATADLVSILNGAGANLSVDDLKGFLEGTDVTSQISQPPASVPTPTSTQANAGATASQPATITTPSLDMAAPTTTTSPLSFKQDLNRLSADDILNRQASANSIFDLSWLGQDAKSLTGFMQCDLKQFTTAFGLSPDTIKLDSKTTAKDLDTKTELKK